MQKPERSEQCEALAPRSRGQFLVKRCEREATLLRKRQISRIVSSESMRRREGENGAVRPRSRILEREPA